MPLTLLQIAQRVVNELGLPSIATVDGNQDNTVRQVHALINRSGDNIYQEYPWIVSQEYHIVDIAAPIITTGDVVTGVTTITGIPSTAGIVANEFAIVANGLLTSTRVVGVVDANTITIDQQPTEGGIGVALTIARDTYAVPADFKWFANMTMWDRTNHWQLIGPMSPQTDQWLRSGIVPTGPRRRWRQVGTEPVNWRLWPPPTASNDYPATLIFEYNSKYWAAAADGTRQEGLQMDTDYAVIDGQSIVLDVKWRLWQAKGFEYGAMQAEFKDYLDRLAARDGGSPDLSLARRINNFYLINQENVPDGNWPGNGNP